jgi:hypothetical protein
MSNTRKALLSGENPPRDILEQIITLAEENLAVFDV